jgi:hypothetical protein
MHTDTTLSILDDKTTILGQQLRDVQAGTFSAYQTRELKREAAARKRRQTKQSSTARTTDTRGTGRSERMPKVFNLQTYKGHAVGDYVETIKQYGTTDSYSSEPVSLLNSRW